MKKTLSLFVIIFLSSICINAQQGYKAFTVSTGYVWGAGSDTYISLDLPNKYFNSFEFYGNVFLANKENNYLAGVAYKYCLNKGLNSALRIKMGVGIGTTTHKAIFSGIAGFEYIYAVSRNIDLMFIPQGGYYLKSDYNWRFSTLGGIRFNF